MQWVSGVDYRCKSNGKAFVYGYECSLIKARLKRLEKNMKLLYQRIILKEI